MSHQKTFTISPIAAAVSAALAAPAAALAQEEGATDVLDEIIVTATKREVNLQKIPASIHALPEAMLKEIGALNTEDYVRFMPSVNWINFNTGGSNQIVFRGVNTTTSGYTGTQSSSVYLDEIPLTATNGSQPDIRMLDVSRTEALSGPQGTLYGAAAQAGTLRIITNKPDPSKFEASADVTYRNGDTSDASHSVTGVFNIPLVEDVFAIRLAVQSAEDGGYIDNVPGHTPDTFYGETAAESAANGGWGANRLDWGSYSNDNVAEKNWNSADFFNLRISARWDINDRWSLTAAYHSGDTDSQGSNAYNPYVGDLETIGFVKDTSHSEWDMSSLTIEADLGFAQFVSATSFFENQRTYVIDNTLYYKYYTAKEYCEDKGVWADHYYNTTYPNYSVYWLWDNPVNGRAIYGPIYCVMPAVHTGGVVGQMDEVIGVGEGPNWQERFTQEFRLTHQGEKFDWLAGLYFEDSNDSWNSVWMKDANVRYQDSMSHAFLESCAAGGATYTEGFPPDTYDASNWSCPLGANGEMGGSAGVAGMVAALANADHYWDSRDDTDWKTTAVFGEVTWHATDQLDVTIGGRWFETENDKQYIKWLAGHTDSRDRHVGGFMQPAWEGNDLVQHAKISEFVPKISLAYTLDEDKMMYALYSEGYRTGGTNRANKNADWDRTLWGQIWDPDKLKNYELGWKSRFADNTLQLNLTYFYMSWEDFQHEVVDPSVGECVDINDPGPCQGSDALPWISIVGNVGEAYSTGATAELDWVPADGWRIGGNAMYLQKELDKLPSPEWSETSGLYPGQKLPNVPEFQGSLWATYTWPVEFVPGAEMFLRGQYSYTGESHTTLIPADEDTPQPSFTNDSYGIADLRIGLVSPDGGWQVDLFVSNVTDERAQINQGHQYGAWQWGRTDEYEHAHRVYTNRPREFGIRFSSRWGD